MYRNRARNVNISFIVIRSKYNIITININKYIILDIEYEIMQSNIEILNYFILFFRVFMFMIFFMMMFRFFRFFIIDLIPW